MKERFMTLLRWFSFAIVPIGGGAIFLGAGLYFLPTAELIHLTHGLVGFLFGILFVIGSAVSCTIAWLITGKNYLDKLFGF